MPPVTTNLDQEDIDMIDHLAASEDMSRAAYLRKAVLAYLEEQ
jgi:predicted transcriptional regulator